MRSLIWFRNDLRLEDHPALAAACRGSVEGVIGVFVISPGAWDAHDWGAAKVDFVLRCVNTLSQSLRKLCIPLKILRVDTFADVPEKLLALARVLKCDRLCFNVEYEVNELQRDRQVESLFRETGLQVQVFHDQTLVRPDDLRTGSGRFYTVFTPYKNAWLKLVRAGESPTPCPAPSRQIETGVTADPVPEAIAGFACDPAMQKLWPAGEKEARRRLENFLAGPVEDYARRRDRPDLEGTSALSPYLAAGVIGIRACFAAAGAVNRGRLSGGRRGPDTWISELIWREFYRHVLVGHPRVCRNKPFKPETDRIPWSGDEEAFQSWCEGRTGFPIVDAAMNQLRSTGWMHNRLRMITAMFLVKDLLIDWRRGEKFFARHLVDLDFASNNGGWQWAASTGTDAVPYFRIFNPTEQSKKFDPEGSFIRRWVPELKNLDARDIHDPPEVARATCGYPFPVVNHKTARERAIAAFKKAAAARA